MLRILTHFIPIRNYVFPNGASSGAEEFHAFNTTYVGQLHPRHLKGGWQRYQQKELNQEILCAYGFGDGGGSPTEWMIEAQRRTTQGIPGCPPTKSTTATAFFEKLKQSLAGKEVPVWSGELYLEYHRGTYTSMARNKKWNRRAEFALTNLEKEAVVTGQLLRKRYPDLTAPWEILMSIRQKTIDTDRSADMFEVNQAIDVVALGELLIDFACISTDTDGYPTMAAHPGSAPANFLAALTKFGAKTALIGKVGTDAFGKMLIGTLEKAGIETCGLISTDMYSLLWLSSLFMSMEIGPSLFHGSLVPIPAFPLTK